MNILPTDKENKIQRDSTKNGLFISTDINKKYRTAKIRYKYTNGLIHNYFTLQCRFKLHLIGKRQTNQAM